MKCKECLVWNNKNILIRREILSFVPNCVHIGMGHESIGIISKYAEMLERNWRKQVSIMDNDCPEGKCTLVSMT